MKPEGGVVDDRLLELEVLGEPSEAPQHLEALPSADTNLLSSLKPIHLRLNG